MGTIWFRMRSELKWRDVEVLSTFITVAELRDLICEKLGLNHRSDTISIVSETDTDPFPDTKQLPRGSRVRVIRTTFDHLSRLKEQEQAEKERCASVAAAAEAETQDGGALEHESEDEFGPSVFDMEAQRRYAAQQAADAKQRSPKSSPSIDVALQRLASDDNANAAETKPKETPSPAPSFVESEGFEPPRSNSRVPLEVLLGLTERNPAVNQEASPETAIVKHTKSPSPAVKSLLEAHPELHWRCKRFLPTATAEMLYQVIGLPRALKRDEWRAFVLANGGPDPEATPSASSSSDHETPHGERSRRDASVSPQPQRRPHKPSRSRPRAISEALSSRGSDDSLDSERRRHRRHRSRPSRESEYRNRERGGDLRRDREYRARSIESDHRTRDSVRARRREGGHRSSSRHISEVRQGASLRVHRRPHDGSPTTDRKTRGGARHRESSQVASPRPSEAKRRHRGASVDSPSLESPSGSKRRPREGGRSRSPAGRADSPGSDRWYANSEALEETPESARESPLPHSRQGGEQLEGLRSSQQLSPELSHEPRKRGLGGSADITSRLQRLREEQRQEILRAASPSMPRKGARPLGLFAQALSKVTQQ